MVKWTYEEDKYVLGVLSYVENGNSFEDGYNKYSKHFIDKSIDDVEDRFYLAKYAYITIIENEDKGSRKVHFDREIPESLFSLLQDVFKDFVLVNGPKEYDFIPEIELTDEASVPTCKIDLDDFAKFRQEMEDKESSVDVSGSLTNMIVKIPSAFNRGMDFFSVLDDLREAKGLTSKQVYTASYIKANTYSDWLNLNRIPKIEQILKLCIGMKLNHDESVTLLKSANCEFGGSDQRARVIEYFIVNNRYNVIDIDDTLHYMKLEPLFQPGMYDSKYVRAK